MDMTRIISWIVAACFFLLHPAFVRAQALIDLGKAIPTHTYDGTGVLVSYGKLLYDYPKEQRDRIMDYLFLPGYGANLQILKVEFGYDGNNTASSWPSYKRTIDEEGVFDRGIGLWYMKEARKRNPDVILSALNWGYPAWAVTDSLKAEFIAGYVIGMYEKEDILIDYIGGNQNESEITPEVTKIVRRKLDSHGLGNVKIICADEGAKKQHYMIFDLLEEDPEYAEITDVIGVHFKSQPDSRLPDDAYSFGIPVWSSEDGGGNYVSPWSGHSWTSQLIRLLCDLKMSAAIRWLSTASVYDNMPWPMNGIMRTKEPWSGSYVIGSNLWAFAHFTQFIDPGWKVLDTGGTCLTDDGRGKYGVFCSADGNEWTIVADTYGKFPEQGLDLTVRLPCGKVADSVYVWRSHFEIPEETFCKAASLCTDWDGRISVHLDKDCVYTMSTVSGQRKGNAVSPEPVKFSLPYNEDFESYGSGRMPRYFVDAHGTFETCVLSDGNTVLRQCIMEKPIIWHPGSSHCSQPVSEMGSMDWDDYSVGIDVMLETQGSVALCCRLDPDVEPNSEYGLEGYWLILSDDGSWKMDYRNEKGAVTVASGNTGYSPGQWIRMELRAEGNEVSAYLEGERIAMYSGGEILKGNIAIATLSSDAEDFWSQTDIYPTACFDNLTITDIGH